MDDFHQYTITPWRPIVILGQDTLKPLSKFGGQPYVEAGDQMLLGEERDILLFQLNLDSIPTELRVFFGLKDLTGLVQVFLDRTDDKDRTDARLIHPQSPEGIVLEGNHFLPRVIVGWEKVTRSSEWVAIESGDFLGGIPVWIQDSKHCLCPECDQEMMYVFQMGSECNVNHGFGDGGVAHLMYCPQHPDIWKFPWEGH